MKKLYSLLVLLAFLLPVGASAQLAGQTTTDCSGTITTGGTAQTLLATSSTRRGFVIMNLSTDKLCFSFAGTAVCDGAGSYSLNPAITGATGAAGGSFVAPYGMFNAVSIVGATTGDKFSCTAW
jgi:hypothetical protein